jgi:hypothetical protein
VSLVRATLGVLAVMMAVAPAGASARRADSLLHNRRLWATVNVCDTVGHPDSIGIRGSMPGSGDKAEVMFMRFEVQVFDQADAHWHGLAGADSGFVEVGSARSKTRQSGNTFTITPPRPGAAPYLLRGVVTFEWREDGAVVRHTRKSTTAAHPKTPGADPTDFSAATCSIT